MNIKKRRLEWARFFGRVFLVEVLAVMALPSVVSAFGWTTGETYANNSGLPGTCTVGFILGVGCGISLYGYIQLIFNWILAVLGFIAVAGFVWAGILYLTAGGDTEKAETAKKAMIYSVIGVLVALSGWVVISVISNFLGGTAQF